MDAGPARLLDRARERGPPARDGHRPRAPQRDRPPAPRRPARGPSPAARQLSGPEARSALRWGNAPSTRAGCRLRRAGGCAPVPGRAHWPARAASSPRRRRARRFPGPAWRRCKERRPRSARGGLRAKKERANAGLRAAGVHPRPAPERPRSAPGRRSGSERPQLRAQRRGALRLRRSTRGPLPRPPPRTPPRPHPWKGPPPRTAHRSRSPPRAPRPPCARRSPARRGRPARGRRRRRFRALPPRWRSSSRAARRQLPAPLAPADQCR